MQLQAFPRVPLTFPYVFGVVKRPSYILEMGNGILLRPIALFLLFLAIL